MFFKVGGVLPKVAGVLVFACLTISSFWMLDLLNIVTGVRIFFGLNFTTTTDMSVSWILASILAYIATSFFEYRYVKKTKTSATINDMQSLLDSISLPVFYKNREYIYLGCNKAFAEHYGLTPKDIIGKTSYDFSSAELASQHHAADDAVIASGSYMIGETGFADSQGNILEVVDHKSPLFDDDGEIVGVIAVIQDITAQKKAEKELHENEKFYKDIANSSSEWAWETDKTGVVTGYWAGEYSFENEHSGIDPRGKTRQQVATPNEEDIDWTIYETALKQHKAFQEFDYCVTNDKGEKYWLQLSGVPYFDDDGTYLGHRGIGINVTAVRRREEENRIFTQRIRDAIEALSEGFILFDENDQLVLVNNKYKEMYPTQADTLVNGAKFVDLVRASINAGEVPLAIGREDEWIAERVRQHKELDQVSVQHLSSGRWVKISEQNITGGGNVGIRTDITELKVAQIEAETSNRVKSEFLANMSHELRTPLNSMIGFSELMKEEAFGPIGLPRYKEYSEDINRAGTHLLSLINDILHISKIEAGEAVIDEIELSLDNVISSCVKLMAVRAKEKEIKLDVTGSLSAIRVMADERQMKQILLNLLSNAVKFTGTGGEISLQTSLTASGGVSLAVIDSGVGIESGEIPKILEPFYQIANATTRHHEGTGLGLSLVKQLIELHGGSLSITSKLGEGTNVTITLPASRVVNTD